MEYISGSSANLKTFAFGNVIGNIVIFIPLGIYLTLFKNDKRVKTNLLFIFIVSLFVEIIQGLLGIGAADIDDIILNCLGGLIGVLGYKFLLFILRDEKKAYTAITILSAIGLPCILYYIILFIDSENEILNIVLHNQEDTLHKRNIETKHQRHNNKERE